MKKKKIKIKWLEHSISSFMDWLPLDKQKQIMPAITWGDLTENQKSINRLNKCQDSISLITRFLKEHQTKIDADFQKEIADALERKEIRTKCLIKKKTLFQKLQKRLGSYTFTFLQKQKKGGDVEVKIQFD